MKKKKKTSKNQPLSEKQRLFVEAYDGSSKSPVKDAAEKAGLSYDYSRRLVTQPHVIQAIKDREGKHLHRDIADRQERQKFWTKVMKTPKESMKNRLHASELLGKSEGDFLEKRIVATGEVDQEELRAEFQQYFRKDSI